MSNACRHGGDSGAYVLDALEPAEREAFERHLLGCENCRHEVRELGVAAEALPLAADQLVPPPELKQRLMAIVGEEASVLAAAGPEADRVGAAGAGADRPAGAAAAVAREGEDRVAERRERRDRGAAWWRRPLLALRPLPAAGLAAALLALGVAGGVLLGQGGPGEARTVAADVSMRRADARVVIQGDRARLVVHGLRAPAAGRVYQVWTQRPDAPPQPTDALFRTTADGRASVDVPGSVDGVQRVLVTAEPDGGSAVPSSSPIVVATLG